MDAAPAAPSPSPARPRRGARPAAVPLRVRPARAHPPSGECPLPAASHPQPCARRAAAALFVRGGGAAHSRPCARCPWGQAAAQLPSSPGTALPQSHRRRLQGWRPGLCPPPRPGEGAVADGSGSGSRAAVGGERCWGGSGDGGGGGWTLPPVSSGGVTWRYRNRGPVRVPQPDPAGSWLPEPPAPGRRRARPPSLGRCLRRLRASPGLFPSPALPPPPPHALCWKPSFVEATRDALAECVCPFILLYGGCGGIANVHGYRGI